MPAAAAAATITHPHSLRSEWATWFWLVAAFPWCEVLVPKPKPLPPGIVPRGPLWLGLSPEVYDQINKREIEEEAAATAAAAAAASRKRAADAVKEEEAAAKRRKQEETAEKKRRKSTTRPPVITCDGVESDSLFIVAK